MNIDLWSLTIPNDLWIIYSMEHQPDRSEHYSIATQIPAYLAIITAIFALVTIASFYFIGKPSLDEKAYQQVNIEAETMMLKLENQLNQATTIARSMAQLAPIVNHETEQYKTILLSAINTPGTEDFIAGGGVWPEPFMFDQQNKRNSFFWGRNKQGKLKFYNDYNQAKGDGYHQQEWYVPLRYIGRNSVYWSHVYTDPYSRQPMVTVSVPVYQNNHFWGITTIDVKLEGLQDFLARHSKTTQGYAFAIDLNDRFICHPDSAIQSDKNTTLTMAEYTQKHPEFYNYQHLVESAFSDIHKPATNPTRKIAQNIASNSDQISTLEANRIHAVITNSLNLQNTTPAFLQASRIKNEYRLKQDVLASIFIIPETYWRVIVVTPIKHVNAATHKIVQFFIWASAISFFLTVISLHFLLRQRLIQPMLNIIKQLTTRSEQQNFQPIHTDEKNELAKLVERLNDNSQQLSIFHTFAATSQQGFVIANLNMTINYSNQALQQLLPNIVQPSMTLIDCFENESRKTFQHEVINQLHHSGNWQGELMLIVQFRPIIANIFYIKDPQGSPLYIAGVFTDITEQKLQESKIEQLAYFDQLTGLANRRMLMQQLQQKTHFAKRCKMRSALIYMDLDDFKSINDTLGHTIGDELLIGIARRLSILLRAEDTVARIGGDEFVILLPLAESGKVPVASQISIVLKKITAAMEEPFLLQNHTLHTSCSMGIVVFPDQADEAEQILRKADASMYQAKKSNDTNYYLYRDELEDQLNQKMLIEQELRSALSSDQLSLYFQPQYNADGQFDSAEVLLRWQHPDKGFISPAIFIPVAEESGLIEKVDQWVMDKALATLHQWNQDKLSIAHLSVNMSAKGFSCNDLPERINEHLKKHQIKHQQLMIEITEGALMEDPKCTRMAMDILCKQGVQFAVDDFGTGYSSLSYIKNLPIQELKIDRCFIKDIINSNDDDTIARTIISMGNSLGLDVIAEGVEEQSQLDFLLKHGCQRFQGYYFSKPLNEPDMRKLLSEKARHVPEK